MIKLLLLCVLITPAWSATHAYWRIYWANFAGGGSGIQTCNFYDSSGVLLNTGGTATDSGHYLSDPSVDGAKAFDNDETTFWTQPATGAQWIAYQFTGPVTPVTVRMSPRDQGGPFPIPDYGPFDLQYSDDGAAWTTSRTLSPLFGNGFNQEQQGSWSFSVDTPALGTYCNWRIIVDATQGGFRARVAEVEFREALAGPDLAPAVNIYNIASARFLTTNFAGAAFDNNPATDWIGDLSVGAWFGYASAGQVKIIEWSIQASASTADGTPTECRLQGSNDAGATWTTVAACTHPTWIPEEVVVFDVPAPAPRKIIGFNYDKYSHEYPQAEQPSRRRSW